MDVLSEKEEKKREFDNSHSPTQKKLLKKCNKRIIEKERLTLNGYDVPDSLVFSLNSDSAFFFGKNAYGEDVGKKDKTDGHIIIIGSSGSGKTTGIAIPSTITWKGTIFMFDFKGDIFRYAKQRRCKILYFLQGFKNRYFYDAFYIFKLSGSNPAHSTRELSNAIIPMPRDAPEPFWINAARNILGGALLYYYRLGASFIDAVIEIGTTSLSEMLEKINSDEAAKRFINKDIMLNLKTMSGVSLEITNYLSVFVTDPLIQEVLSPTSDDGTEKEPITWEDLECQDVIIRMNQSDIEQYDSVIRLLLVQLVRRLGKRPEKYSLAAANIKPTLLLLDEFPQYGKIDSLTASLKVLRSKKVTFALFCQSFADLDETYGKYTRRTILDNCPYKLILNAFDAETQQYCSDLVGKVVMPTLGYSTKHDAIGNHNGYNMNISENIEPIIFPHEFASMDDIILLCPEPERFCRLKKETRYRKLPYAQKGEYYV